MTAALDSWYPPSWAQPWDRVGLVLGEPDTLVRRVLLAVDVTPETAAEAFDVDSQLMVAHHPLLLRGVSSVAPTTYKGRIVHQLIRGGVALFVAHTNADVANPGVSDALAARLGLTDTRPLRPAEGAAAGEGRGLGRVGGLPSPLSLADFLTEVSAALPRTSSGVRAAGDPRREIRSVAVCGGAGDEFLADAIGAAADAYLTADLRHHPASEHLADGGPALLDATHWATERPWLDTVAERLAGEFDVETAVSDISTDPWNLSAR
ncbi:MAG: Nif3-like dinuclear metal center hexameric protein [Micromonosporaceae bacterium]|nr:Nif3-like dinuclear metal center hexameric protein [Micromonosporaceae bacterium]